MSAAIVPLIHFLQEKKERRENPMRWCVAFSGNGENMLSLRTLHGTPHSCSTGGIPPTPPHRKTHGMCTTKHSSENAGEETKGNACIYRKRFKLQYG